MPASLCLYLFPEGELYMGGTLYRAEDGEAFLAAWSALAETGVDTLSLRLYEKDADGMGYPGTERISFTLPETAWDPRKTDD